MRAQVGWYNYAFRTINKQTAISPRAHHHHHHLSAIWIRARLRHEYFMLSFRAGTGSLAVRFVSARVVIISVRRLIPRSARFCFGRVNRATGQTAAVRDDPVRPLLYDHKLKVKFQRRTRRRRSTTRPGKGRVPEDRIRLRLSFDVGAETVRNDKSSCEISVAPFNATNEWNARPCERSTRFRPTAKN